MVRRARRNVFLLDASKLGKRAAHFLLPWAAVDSVLSDAKPRDVARLAPEAAGVLWRPGGSPPQVPEVGERGGELPVHFL